MKIIKKLKENYGYFKAGVREEMKENKRLTKIKNTPWEERSKANQAWADIMNKTNRKKSKGFPKY